MYFIWFSSVFHECCGTRTHADRTTDFAYVMDASAHHWPYAGDNSLHLSIRKFPRFVGRAFVLWSWRRAAASGIRNPVFDVLWLNLYGRHTITNNAEKKIYEQQIKLIKECNFIKLIQSISACFMCFVECALNVDCAPTAPMTRYVYCTVLESATTQSKFT